MRRRSLSKRLLRYLATPRKVFATTLIAALIVGVPAAYAVGWVTFANEVELGPRQARMSSGPVYSSSLRMYQNQTQLGPTDPDLVLEYHYPDLSLFTFISGIGWGDVNPFLWSRGGGNKWACCQNPSGVTAGRVVTCQRYATS